MIDSRTHLTPTVILTALRHASALAREHLTESTAAEFARDVTPQELAEIVLEIEALDAIGTLLMQGVLPHLDTAARKEFHAHGQALMKRREENNLD